MAGAAMAALTPDRVFDYAEANLPNYFPGHPATSTLGAYTYRHYPGSGNYLAVSGSDVYVLGPITDDELYNAGPVASYESKVLAWEASKSGSTSPASTGPRIYGKYAEDGPAHRRISGSTPLGAIFHYSGYNGTQGSRTEEPCQYRRNSDGSVSELAGTTEVTRYTWEDTTLQIPADAELKFYASNKYADSEPDTGKWVIVYPNPISTLITVFLKSNGDLCVDGVWRGGYDASRFQFISSADFSLQPYQGDYKATVLGESFTSPPGKVATLTSLLLNIDAQGVVKVTVEAQGGKTLLTFDSIDNRLYKPPLDLKNLNKSPVVEFPENKYRLFHINPLSLSCSLGGCWILELDPNLAPSNAYRLYYGVKNFDATPGKFDYDGYIRFYSQKLK